MGFLSHQTHANSFLFITTLFIFVSIHLCLSSMNDTITSNTSIEDNHTITSNNTNFKLGFFSPPNSTNRYAAIWYLSDSYIIWIANRDQAVKDSSGVIKIHKDGNLVVMDGRNYIVWSTNLTFSTKYVTNISSAQLQDNGNLVLRDGKTGETVWDSFTHPADAAMPRMKITANKITGKKMEYVSWKSPTDPSSGDYSVSMERLAAPELFLWYKKSRPYYRTGPWNGRTFLGSPRMLTEYLYGWRLDHDPDGTNYLTYNFADPDAFAIVWITYDGKLRMAKFLNQKNYYTIDIFPKDCDYYGACGPFGNCDPNSIPICSCFEGFEPRNVHEWSKKNWSSGCVRKKEAQLQCDRLKNLNNNSHNGVDEVQQDGFKVFNNMKVPDFAERSDDDVDNCRTSCLANCSCLAYAYDSYIGCMFWIRDLIDLEQFSIGGVDLFLRVPHSQLATGNKGRRVSKSLIIATIAGVIGVIALAICGYITWQKWTAKQARTLSQKKTTVGEQNQMKLDELPLFEFEKLATATNNFHAENMLGKGGFGPVYKGHLEDGQEIAVKRLSKASGQGLEEFMNEVVVISKLQHRNLVRLLGCCVEPGEQMLVYEFMPNKSLDAFLFDPQRRKVLDWKKRFNIIEGIARGILYLHRDSRLRIIHRDLKASNILLDDAMNPKISDFGLARIFRGDEDDEASTKKVIGTYGYMPPEYAMEGLFSEKSDVYSFGVLLLEIVSGRRNTSFYNHRQSLSLVGYAWKLWNENNIISLIDPEIMDPCFEKSILRCIHIGLLCVQELTKERPTISTVVLMLISEITHLPPPGQVAFVHKQNLYSSESSHKSHPSTRSNNNLTLSEIEGR
ncbi:G-type lectin S-receptor-like serine/threonine-protein kinase At1g11300 isoform X1 [Arachis duranensis]|uniref:Receptor-like serine/threonine-protein kinase n=1 Tax=Arachis duranensis TaxID=130453 RepID=A0A6P4CF75_ARADU|nr:G-type lectin S-receptor-like serine/threonine-protein kinase At1g11300 isoform X1 [Arachis duranensis]QHO53592.1 G-type lectin S-receptor-like serine/threonine-protein kinase [Arachis hypogaea]